MPTRILRRPAVEERTGLPTSTLYLKMRQGAFPRPVPLGPGRNVGWLESEVEAWIEAQVRAARGPQPDAPTAA